MYIYIYIYIYWLLICVVLIHHSETKIGGDVLKQIALRIKLLIVRTHTILIQNMTEQECSNRLKVFNQRHKMKVSECRKIYKSHINTSDVDGTSMDIQSCNRHI